MLALGTQPKAANDILLHNLFEQQALRRPDHTALSCKGVSLTYRELDELSNKVARALQSRGVKSGSLVGIYFRKSINLFAAILGVLKAGAGYVPIDPKFPVERIRDIFCDAEITVALSEGPLGGNIKSEVAVDWLLFDAHEQEIAAQSASRPESDASLSTTCYAIYTSGSTGRPKGVRITHRNALTFVRTLPGSYGVTEDDRIYQGFSVAFDASVEEIWAAFSLGATLFVATEETGRSPQDVADFIDKENISYFSTVPTFLSMIPRDLPSVRLLVLGGEACAMELVQRWAKPGIRRMLNTYGPTEATVVATMAECVPGEPVTIGAALPGYQTYVLDEHLKPVLPGEEGELFIGGDAIAAGYINRPELTAERFIANPFSNPAEGQRLYRTSDLVRLGHSGELYFLGRIDGQIKIRGFRVELSEIEAVLLEHEKVAAAAVGVTEVNGIQELAAYIVGSGEIGNETRLELRELLRSRVPDYMVPKYLDVVEQLPLMTSGKVDRRQLPPPQTILKGVDRAIVEPATQLEQQIRDIWCDCLRVSPISVEDDFFLDLGGHSLLAAQVATELRERLQLPSASVRQIYEYRTVRRLSAALADAKLTNAQMPELPGAEIPSLKAFHLVTPLERWLCVFLQAVSLGVYYLIITSPIVYAVLMYCAVRDGVLSFEEAAYISTFVGFAIWPSMLVISILMKWLIIGRYVPGRYPVWSLYYFRWWVVNRFQALSWSYMFVGTPLMSLYYRAMGAKIGKHCNIYTSICSAFDLISIGDNSAIGADTQLLGYRVEDGMLIIGPITIGRDCFVGMHCGIGVGVEMGDGAALDDMSLLTDGTVLKPAEQQRGVPAVPGSFNLPCPSNPGQPKRRRPILFGFLHLALIYVMGYFLIFAFAPPAILLIYAFVKLEPLQQAEAFVLATPLSYTWFILCTVFVKRVLIGRIKPGTYSTESVTYLRYWFQDYLLNNTREILMPLYATIYFPTFLRLLGAKIGRGVEASTIMNFSPDLVKVNSGSFLADACLVGGRRIHKGCIVLERTTIGERTFIGNSAFVPGGTRIGDDCLLGVMSVPPSQDTTPADGKKWLGSPAFELPNTAKVTCRDNKTTYAPTIWMRLARSVVDLFRILLPGWMAMAGLIAFCEIIAALDDVASIPQIVLFTPLIACLLSIFAIAAVAGIKNAVIGRFEPETKPLWCSYVWFNELINGVYESIAANSMTPFLGTPFAAPCLRLFGCKIGKWVFLETTLFSEFDLVHIGNYAALNIGSTIQTHLFEDRVMKADHLRIEDGCSVGNMSIVLYSTKMYEGATLCPLSVLMKGENLPALSCGAGIPSEPMAQPANRGEPLNWVSTINIIAAALYAAGSALQAFVLNTAWALWKLILLPALLCEFCILYALLQIKRVLRFSMSLAQARKPRSAPRKRLKTLTICTKIVCIEFLVILMQLIFGTRPLDETDRDRKMRLD